MSKFLSVLYGLVTYAFFIATSLYAIGFVGDIAVPKAIYTGTHYLVADAGGSATTPDEFFDYFPSQYANQATEIEELPAQF